MSACQRLPQLHGRMKNRKGRRDFRPQLIEYTQHSLCYGFDFNDA